MDRVRGNGSRERTAEIDPPKTDGRDPTYPKRTAEIERSTTGSRQTDLDDVSGDVISGGGSAARARKLAGERRRFGTNEGHQDVERDAANSPVTKDAAEEQRTAPATRKKWRRRQRHKVTRR